MSRLSPDAFAFLQNASHIPPGAIPLAARAARLRTGAATRLEEEAERLVRERRAALEAELPERRRQVGINFNLRMAELARRRGTLSKDARAGPDEMEEVVRDQKELAEQRALAFRDLDAAPGRVVPGAVRFLAHALVLPATGDEEREAFDADVEKVAMAVATEWERSRGAEVTDVSTGPLAREAGLADHPGFDLLAVDADGAKRRIEVKGRTGRAAVWMEENEYRAACNLGAAYWLYVVLDCASSVPHLSRVRDPFAKLLARNTTRMRISAAEVESAAEAGEP